MINYDLIGKKYNPKLSTRENAELIKVPVEWVALWKRLHGYIKIGEVDEELFYKYYLLNYFDQQIAKKLNISIRKVELLRKEFNLPSNVTRGFNTKYKSNPFEDPESLYCDGEFLKMFVKKEIE